MNYSMSKVIKVASSMSVIICEDEELEHPRKKKEKTKEKSGKKKGRNTARSESNRNHSKMKN